MQNVYSDKVNQKMRIEGKCEKDDHRNMMIDIGMKYQRQFSLKNERESIKHYIQAYQEPYGTLMYSKEQSNVAKVNKKRSITFRCNWFYVQKT
jgi:hypothetical protein